MINIKNQKEKKYKFIWYEFYEKNALLVLLEDMAKQGWMVEKIHYHMIVFQKQNPKYYKFHMDVLHGLSTFRFNRERAQEEYFKTYERKGWTYVTSIRKFPIFYTEREDNAIEVDLEEEKNVVFRLFEREVFPLWLFITFFFLFSFVGSQREVTFYTVSSTLMLIQQVFFGMLLFSSTISIVGWLNFLWRYNKNRKIGLGFPSVSRFLERIRKIIFLLSIVVAGLLLLIALGMEVAYNGIPGIKTYVIGILPFLCVLGVIFPIWKQIGGYRLRTYHMKTYLILYGSFILLMMMSIALGGVIKRMHPEEPMISMEEFGIKDMNDSFEKRESFALLWEQYRGISKDWCIFYEVIKGKNHYYYRKSLETVFEKYYRQLLRRGGMIRTVDEDWGANTVIAVDEKEKSPYSFERILFFPNNVMIWIEVEQNRSDQAIDPKRWRELVRNIHDTISPDLYERVQAIGKN